MVNKTQKKTLKKRIKIFLSSRRVIKLRRSLMKWQRTYFSLSIKQNTAVIPPISGDVEAIFEEKKNFPKLLSLRKIATFIILFVLIGGAYLLLKLITRDPIDHAEKVVVNHELDESNKVKVTMLADRKDDKAAAKQEANAFTLQPFIDLSAPLSLIRTINPHFFIQAAENQQIKVSILIVGLGINQTLSDEIIEQAPKNISLVFSPYTPLLENEIEAAQIEGFSVLVSVPLEDEDAVTDQGYLTVKSKATELENEESLKKIAISSLGANCFYGQGGARLLRSQDVLYTTFSYIKQVNNCLVAPPDILVNRLHEVAAKISLNYVCTTIENPTEDLIAPVEALAKRTGYAIVAFDAKPGVLDEIKKWIKKLEQAKLSIVPITEIIHN